MKLEHEERSFVLHALAYDPLGEAAAALRNWGRQLVTVGYDEPLRDPAYYLSDEYWKTTTLKPLLLRDKPCDPEVGACILHLPAVLMSEIDAGVALLALGWIGVTLAVERRRLPSPSGGGSGWGGAAPYPEPNPHPDPLPSGRGEGPAWRDPALRTRATVVLMVLAVALNGAVCGVLSGPFARYEARVLWLIPAAALLLWAARRAPTR